MFLAEYLSVLTAQVDEYSRTGLITSSGIKAGLGRDFEPFGKVKENKGANDISKSGFKNT